METAAPSSSNGHFAWVIVNPDTPKFASGNRAQGTADENKTAVLGGLAFFGTYSVKDKVSYLKIERKHVSKLDRRRANAAHRFILAARF
ncbi:lipocalin-like domain-containing protein [Caballeronia grimmiae]|uniref:hypothetical protein n=1 Tax=Caballeronia grimmiae TaxID=1071679 RepID=UPI0038B90285